MNCTNSRRQLLRRGRWVETGSCVYSLIEATVSLVAGLFSGSAALVSWGLNAIVEAASAGAMIWRIHGEESNIGSRRLLWRKKVALSIIAAAFWIVVAFILYKATTALIAQRSSEFSALGLGIVVASLIVNPVLAWGKYHYGKQLDSAVLIYDAKETLICQYQTMAVLIGLVLTQTMGWWWADPVAALTIVPYVAWEGLEASQDAWKIDPEANGRKSG